MKYLNKEINGIALSRIGLGAMRMADVQQGVDTIHAALDSGITYLNTGDFYGHGESELVIREALKTRKREELFISVKFGGMLTPDDRFYGIDVRPQSVQNYLAYTLKRLGTDYVDLYQPARINPHIPVEETIGAVADLVKAGYVRHIGITEIDAASQGLAVSGNSSRSVLTSILGRAFYSYKNRYLLTATIRRDGSSKFGSNYRYGNFPSVSVGWNIAEEDFVKNSVSWLDQLKLRGGYGVLGNQEIDNYQYVSVVTTGINYPDGKSGLIQGAFPKTFANPDIKWEETAMTNVGIDFMALRNRLTLTADWYVKNTKDILLNVPIPISTGGANDPIRNAGKIRNQGFEFNLGWNESLNKDLSYGVSFLGTYNKNEVVEMGAESQVITGGTIHGGTYTSRTLAGYPIGGFWLIPTDGYFNSTEEVQAHQKDGVLIQPSAEPGDIRFKDTNNDGTINDEDRVYCGSPFPKFTYSINGNITYKNVDFSIGFQGVTGNKIYNATKLELTDVTRGTNYLASTLDYWTPENQNASSPRLIWTDPNRNARSESDRYLESGSYFRLRNLQVGYTLPTVWFHGFVQKARVYVNAENLFTISSYSGYTPDVNSSDVYSRGFDEFIYPSNRTFMFGLNVTF